MSPAELEEMGLRIRSSGQGYIVFDRWLEQEWVVEDEAELERLLERLMDKKTYYPLGDALATLTSAFGIAECEACKKRRQQLNRLVPRLRRRP